MGKLPGASDVCLLVEEGSLHGSWEGTESMKAPTETSLWGTGRALRRQT